MTFESKDGTLSIIAQIIIMIASCSGMIFAVYNLLEVSKVKLNVSQTDDSLLTYGDISQISSSGEEYEEIDSTTESVYNQSEKIKIVEIYNKIRNGSFSFIKTEILCFIPVVLFVSSFIILLISMNTDYRNGIVSGACFITGAVASIICGSGGMCISTFSNARTTIKAKKSLAQAFVIAFKGALAFSLFVCSFFILIVFSIVKIMNFYYPNKVDLYYIFCFFGLGGSFAGLFWRISGGIFTKGADVGADSVGKVEENMNEDDPRNPAVIADNVGDNVGDVAGMGSDILGSSGEAISSSFIIISNTVGLSNYSSPYYFPLLILSFAVIIGILISFFATTFMKPKKKQDVELSLEFQILIFTIIMILVSLLTCLFFLPSEFNVAKNQAIPRICTNYKIFFCICLGLLGGALVSITTKYYTSNAYEPVRELARSAETGPATVIIYGLALGGHSTVIPVVLVACMIYFSYYLGDSFGVSMMALGLLSPKCVILTIDTMGPIVDNAGGIAEMAGLDELVRKRTDILDAAGNTTAAVGKGFANSLASIVGFTLLYSFTETAHLENVNILDGLPLFGASIGVAVPYLFSSLLNKSVGKVAGKMVEEVRRQFRQSEILSGESEPDYQECIRVATMSSIIETVPPCILTFAPVVIGPFLGRKALAGYILSILTSGYAMSIFLNNAGGAFDNAKKLIESGYLGPNKGKNSQQHYSAVIGDTVGDPLKDTSGPSINTLMKITAILSVAMASTLPTEGILERLIT